MKKANNSEKDYSEQFSNKDSAQRSTKETSIDEINALVGMNSITLLS